MDLFDQLEVALNATPPDPEPERPTDEWDDIDFGPWDDPANDPSPEVEAFRIGQDAAGCPSWSSSVHKLQKRLQAILDRLPTEDQAAVVQAFKDGEEATRERHALRLLLDAEEIPTLEDE